MAPWTYITKPWSNDELLAQVAQAVESRRLRDENVQLKRALKQRFNFPNIVGKSDKMQVLLNLVTQVRAFALDDSYQRPKRSGIRARNSSPRRFTRPPPVRTRPSCP